MSDLHLEPPELLPADELLQHYLNSSVFLTNNVWKIAFSPCNHYLAIPKQDIYGRGCVVVVHCDDWYASARTSQLCIHHQFACETTVWSLAFGQRRSTLFSKITSLLPAELLVAPLTRRQLLGRRRSSLSVVNRRYDFTHDLFLAAGLANGKINIWNIKTGELTLILQDHHSTVRGLAFTSCTMQLASCSHDTTVKFWDLLDDGNMYKTLDEWTHVINEVKWSPDETLLCIVGPFELVLLYDTLTWKVLFKLEGHLHSVVDCTFSSDSALLATASHDTRVLLWSTSTGELLKDCAHKIPIPSMIYIGGDNGAFVRSVLFTTHNHFLVTVCDDNKIRWFPVVSNRHPQPIFERTQNNVLCVAATSDGRTMAVSTRSGEVHLLSTFSIPLTREPPTLKSFCRTTINACSGLKRRYLAQLPVSKHLQNYLMYADVKAK